MIFAEKITTIKNINWFTIVDPKYVRFKIKPDSSARNYRTEDFVKTIADQFKLPIDRIIRQAILPRGYKVQERASFEIDFKENNVTFYIGVPETIAPLIYRRLTSIWDKTTIDKVDNAEEFNINKSVIYELVYSKHDLYSLHTDSKDNLPLISLIEAGRLIGENEKARLFCYLDPIYQLAWQGELDEAWDKLRSGNAPRKWNQSFKNISFTIAIGLTEIIREVITGLSDLISDGNSQNIYAKKPSDPEGQKYTIENLSNSTKEKRNKSSMRTYLWIIAESEESARANTIARTIASSFHDISLDNELAPCQLKGKKANEVLRIINTHKPPRVKLNFNIMSSAEISKIVQIPGRELQEKYPEIERVELAEVEVNNKFLDESKGIELGDATFKGQTIKVYQPVNDPDEACLPNVGIGGMGQGKTKGLCANWLIGAYLKGYGGLAIDPNKREIGDQIEFAVKAGIVKREDFIRIDLGQQAFSLDWCETLHDSSTKARLAGTAIDFFGVSDDTTGQTERFLRASIIGMTTGKVSEIIKIFNDKSYLKQVIDGMDEGLNKATLKEFEGMSDGMKGKILSPIYNRLNRILSDPHLANCVNSNNSLDMVQLMSQKKIVVFDVPSDDLDKSAIDVIINLLCSKIDIAMRLRKKIYGAEAEFPFYIMLDEPHQFLRSASIWEAAAVESRKWKIGYFWTFHYWEQIPNNLQKAIRNALPHYHLYPTSKLTWISLKEEVYPFVLEDCLKLKRWHAINIIRSGGENAVPFICKMQLPPEKRFKSKKGE